MLVSLTVLLYFWHFKTCIDVLLNHEQRQTVTNNNKETVLANLWHTGPNVTLQLFSYRDSLSVKMVGRVCPEFCSRNVSALFIVWFWGRAVNVFCFTVFICSPWIINVFSASPTEILNQVKWQMWKAIWKIIISGNGRNTAEYFAFVYFQNVMHGNLMLISYRWSGFLWPLFFCYWTSLKLE